MMGAAGTSAAQIGTDVLLSKGVYYQGLVHLGNGAPLASMLWGCIAIFAILNQPLRGAITAAVGALLVFFGIIHSPMVGIAQGPALMFVYAYLMMSGLFVMKYFLDKGKSIEAQQPETAEKISKSV